MERFATGLAGNLPSSDGTNPLTERCEHERERL